MDHSESMIRLAQAEWPYIGVDKDRDSTSPSPAGIPDETSRGTDTPAPREPGGFTSQPGKPSTAEPPASPPAQPAQPAKTKAEPKPDPGAVVREVPKPTVPQFPHQPQGFDWFQPSLLIGGALLIAAIGLALNALRTKPNHRDGVDVARVTRDIATALRKPGLPLEQVAGEIQRIETGTANLVAAYEDLKERDRKATLRASNPSRKRIDAAVVFLEDSISAAQSLTDHAEFARIDQVLSVQDAYKAGAKALREMPDGDWLETGLLTALERGDFNAALTFPSFLEAYFPDQRDWRRLRTALGAGEAALRSLLEEQGFQILTTPILSIISPADIREPPTTDIRSVRTIPEVQKLAARVARDLGHREFLIVDCHTPGWISDKHGRRAPQFTVFDPTSWT
jgi:hypothetical protein